MAEPANRFFEAAIVLSRCKQTDKTAIWENTYTSGWLFLSDKK
ncbi:hypothetical protein CLOBOL_01466 [Enterocloster bolteae ATCC BAA-613]|uniref:Uncharacterized protein n=1 Tax=Enterocloster bolteae (strain ATCC BAA-613 / DSM 15670 / CCUG 46953 / JCM 12243 / WAL 16351) TaxID=411902 RepID=A8RL04_ENTBW|nr:hypothetical protein CLOBOL_01466 [Enterocloster bolteae ATCC BAA-613]